MSANFIVKLSFKSLNDFIWNAQKRIFYSYPSLHPEIALSIKSKFENNNNLDIRVVIDPSEKNFRNGYGDIKAIDILKNFITIYEAENNLISFIITDDEGFFIFPESRLFEEDGKSFNAARLSRLDILKLIKHFFPPKDMFEKDELFNLTSDADVESRNELKQIVIDIDNDNFTSSIPVLNTKKFQEVRKNLEINPPLEPDLKRKIDVYTAKIQFVELSFTGVNFDVKKVSIPIEALPIKDERLINILETKIRLFENLRYLIMRYGN